MDFYIDSPKQAEKLCASPLKLSFAKQFQKELTLPDFAADISRIIDCGLRISESGFNCENGKITVCGELSFNILYLSDRDSALHKYDFSEDYSQSFDVSGESDVIFSEAYAREPAVRLSGTRKISLKADCEFSFAAVNRISVPDAELEESSERLEKSISGFDTVTLHSGEESVSEDIGLPKSMPQIAELLYCGGLVGKATASYSEGKYLICAEAELNFIYRSEDDNCYAYKCYIPLTQIAESENYGDTVLPSFDIYGIKYASSPDNSGENRIISVDFTTKATATVFAERNITYTSDAFGTEYPTRAETVSFEYSELSRLISEKVEVKDGVPDDNGEIEKILFIRPSAKIRMVRTEGALLTADGICELVIFAKTTVGGFAAYEHSVPFECSFNLPEGSEAIIFASVENSDFKKAAEGFEIYADISVKGIAAAAESADAVSALVKTGEAAEKDGHGLIIYYPDKGETLWSIAKSHGVSTESIRIANDLEGNEPKEKKYILIPRS